MKNLKIQATGCTDLGQIRLKNEDYFGIADNLFIVADGMGGHKSGEIASKLAVETIIDFFQNELNKGEFKKDINLLIEKSIKKANKLVFQRSLNNENPNGMGTTIVLALFQEPRVVHIANVGDSRAYLSRNDKLEVLSEDHSVTANLLRESLITKEEARNHPYHHHLTRSIGIKQDVEIYYHILNVLDGDKLLLCSDGLWNVLSDEEIKYVLQKKISIEKICKELLNQVNKKNGSDNITAVVISVSND